MAEFTASATARARNIDNELPPSLIQTALETLAMMERIRTALSAAKGHDVAITVTSGYRCADLCAAIGSSGTSDHTRAMAVDWIAPGFGSPLEICKFLVPRVDALGIGQLIYECPQSIWIHTASRTQPRSINKILTIDKSGTHVGIEG